MVWGFFGHTEGILKRSDVMIEQDTVRLLRECDAGIKMGISSIDDVLGHVENRDLYEKLSKCRADHEQLQRSIQELLGEYKDCMECHVESDTLLIWFDEDSNIVKLIRLGTHSELFK
jgi:addiction module RelE/StbE family toxin